MGDDTRFMELWRELAPRDISDLAARVDGRDFTRGHWPDLAEVGLLTSPWGTATHLAHSLIRWARATGRLKLDREGLTRD